MSEAVQDLRIFECPPSIAEMSPVEVDEPVDAESSRGLFGRFWQWLRAKRQAQIAAKRLRVSEQVSLGEKRFVAVVEVGRQQFLVGGSSSAVSLLATLEPEQSFSQVLHKRGLNRR